MREHPRCTQTVGFSHMLRIRGHLQPLFVGWKKTQLWILKTEFKVSLKFLIPLNVSNETEVCRELLDKCLPKLVFGAGYFLVVSCRLAAGTVDFLSGGR